MRRLALSVALVVLVAGCSDDSTATTATPVATVQATTTTAEPPTSSTTTTAPVEPPIGSTTTASTLPTTTTSRCLAACRAAARICDESECTLWDGEGEVNFTPIPEGPYPAWHLFFDYEDTEAGFLEASIEPGDHRNSFGGLCDPHRCVIDWDFPTLFLDCDLPDCGYQVDLAVRDTGYSGTTWFSAFLDLHGYGTSASWFAQIGYTWSADGGLRAACQAGSSSSDAPWWWQDSGLSFGFDEWHTFSIRTVETGSEWGYAFEGFIDGEPACSYEPPEGWDTDNCGVGWCIPLFEPFDAIHRTVEIRPGDETNTATEPIVVLIDNFYADFTPPDLQD